MRSLYNWGALVLPLFTSLAASFTPPQVFQHSNLLRTIDLSKPYARETVAAVVENVSGEPQSEYYLPVDKSVLPRLSYVEARDKKGAGEAFVVTPVEFDEQRYVQFPEESRSCNCCLNG